MSALADWIARRLWINMLRFMRLQPVRSMRHWFMANVPDHVRRRMIRQDAFARRHGLPVLRFSLTIMLGSLAITATYFFALWLFQTGVLSPERTP